MLLCICCPQRAGGRVLEFLPSAANGPGYDGSGVNYRPIPHCNFPCYHNTTVAADTATETELARRLLRGDPGAFDEFVQIYRPRLFQYAYLVCGNRDDAEEVIQEALLKVFEKLDQLREPEHLKAWVYRIARNACLMKRRKSTFAPAQELSLDELIPETQQTMAERNVEIADRTRLPEEAAIYKEMSQLLHHTIEELPPIYRSVLVLRDIQELSTRETAEVLEITEDTVKTRLRRARLAVRDRLDHHLLLGKGPP